MATIVNRSPWAVSVRNRDDLYREFPYNKQQAAAAYGDALKGQGLKASVKRLANQYQVLARDKGYRIFCQTVDSLAEAERLKLYIEKLIARALLSGY